MTTLIDELELPNVLSRLGKMTAIRDTYLVEQSLLRTLGPLLGVLRTSLYRLNEHGAVARSQHYSRDIAMDQFGIQRIVENIEEVNRDESIPANLKELFEGVHLLGKPCTRKTGADLTMCYPLLGGSELCGYFVFERDHAATATENAMIAGVLEVFNNYYALLDTSQRDRLTGLLNRYSLELNLDRLWTLLSTRRHDRQALNSVGHETHLPDTSAEPASRRAGLPQTYWFGIIDIDHFKQINDTNGHIIGDEILIMIARLLERSFRSSDLLYRYGGEEFVAVIAADDLDAACEAFERVRRTIASFQFPQVGQVTVSIGFSGADPSVLPQEIINRSDRALYEAKSDGRNLVHHYDTLIERGVLQAVPTGTVELW